MDYTKLTPTILPQVLEAMRLINNPEVDPVTRQLNQEILFREVGAAVYAKVYAMNAWDMEIAHTTGPGMDNRFYGLAKVASDSVSAGGLGVDAYVANYLDSVIGQAQQHAFMNAKQSGKHPTLTWTPTGSHTCKWCLDKSGTYTDPSPADFAHHDSCNCKRITEGFKSRNGLLSNYAGA
jgi:hypothetical protein